ncbi:hypothetical protein Pint_03294 [Pistacia integerrima]|uniref:Uncharacterized protein n=1 Tax=Pistacia integerrima TaxID=434235 RepID=A0ACC0ZPF4_9ROSI|nr:hypothetical protein Pint_03294 [Pistacia integerrima]
MGSRRNMGVVVVNACLQSYLAWDGAINYCLSYWAARKITSLLDLESMMITCQYNLISQDQFACVPGTIVRSVWKAFSGLEHVRDSYGLDR